MTKLGQIAGNLSCDSSVKASHRSNLTQATSGERSPPYGKRKMVEELKTFPNLVWRFQIFTSAIKSASLFTIIPRTGGIIISCFLAVHSSFQS